MLRLCFLILLLLAYPLRLYAEPPAIAVVSITGPVSPVTVDYLQRNLKGANLRGDRLFLIEMDTPGGLDSAMRSIVKDIFASSVPVAVFVAPSGARAASAGAVIALAADICAMAPGTNIGAAHPVTMGEKPDQVMEHKILNDAEAYVEGIARKRGRDETMAKKMVRDSVSLSAEMALQSKVIDLVALDRKELLAKLDGRVVVRGGTKAVLHLSGASVIEHEMGARDKILSAVSNPDVAYVLMLLGILGLFFELSNPGVILPGVIGGISLILAFFAFQTLPVNYAGALLVLLAIVLFVAEIKIVSHGVLAVGGVVALVLGGVLMFPSPEPYWRLSLGVIAGSVAVVALFFLAVIVKVMEAQRQKPVTGVEGLIGTTGVAVTDIASSGKVLLGGEYWNATSKEPIAKGEEVEVAAIAGLRLTVRKRSQC